MRQRLRQSSAVHRRGGTGSRREGSAMADDDRIAPGLIAESNPAHSPAIDEEDRLRPEFVNRVLDAVDEGDDETARRLVQPLHPAHVADLIELAKSDEREGLVQALAGIISPNLLAEL